MAGALSIFTSCSDTQPERNSAVSSSKPPPTIRITELAAMNDTQRSWRNAFDGGGPVTRSARLCCGSWCVKGSR